LDDDAQSPRLPVVEYTGLLNGGIKIGLNITNERSPVTTHTSAFHSAAE
jgi:hypothetical protein